MIVGFTDLLERHQAQTLQLSIIETALLLLVRGVNVEKDLTILLRQGLVRTIVIHTIAMIIVLIGIINMYTLGHLMDLSKTHQLPP